MAIVTPITTNLLTSRSTRNLLTSRSTSPILTSASPNTTSKINTIMNHINKYISTTTQTDTDTDTETETTTTTPPPRVIISALNTTNGLEVSEIAAQVFDTMTYSLCNNKLSQSLSSSTTSTLEIYHTEFSTVILGCGCTFVEKLISLVGGDYKVYIPILVYTILKYVIALLIYGDLNVKYLYRSHNNQFL